MKKLAFILAFICSQFVLHMPVQAARIEAHRVEGRTADRAGLKEQRSRQRSERKALIQDWKAQRKEHSPKGYGKELFLGSIVWLICGLVLMLIGLIMLFFGGLFVIFGASIAGLGLLMLLSFIIYKAVS